MYHNFSCTLNNEQIRFSAYSCFANREFKNIKKESNNQTLKHMPFES